MTQVLEAAQALAPEISERASEGEAGRTLPRDLVDKMAAAGLFSLGLPKDLDGLECEPAEIIAVVEAISYADGSAGWCSSVGNNTPYLAWLDPDVARPMLETNPGGAMAAAFAPAGRAVPGLAPQTFTVSGRWAFNSGCPHSDWLGGGVLVMDEEGPRMLKEGRPDWRWAWFPASEAEILDTWHVAGLKGTGSHDITVSGITVPEERMCMPFFNPARHDGPLYRMSFFNLNHVLASGFPLGVARRALDEFISLTQRKSRALSGATLADDPIVQVEIGRADPALRAADRISSKPSTRFGTRSSLRACRRSSSASASDSPPTTCGAPPSRVSTPCSHWRAAARSTTRARCSAAGATSTRVVIT